MSMKEKVGEGLTIGVSVAFWAGVCGGVVFCIAGDWVMSGDAELEGIVLDAEQPNSSNPCNSNVVRTIINRFIISIRILDRLYSII